MSIKEIELAITHLTPKELSQFTVWFEEFQARAWDERIEKDIEAGRCKPL